MRNYILTALPTGSRFIAKQKICDLSAASIRNVMGDLEERGLITHPHTSAGRIPTDTGFRFYVDQLMQHEMLSQSVKDQIRHEIIDVDPSDMRFLLEATSKALSKATDQLGIILSPTLRSGVFRHLHSYPVDTQRYLLTVTIDSGFVKTLIVELSSTIIPEMVEAACVYINNRCSGKSIQDTFFSETVMSEPEMQVDIGIIKLFIPSIQKMLEKEALSEVYAQGEVNMLLKPEFASRTQLSSIIEILGEKKLLMHILSNRTSCEQGALISIGGEIEDDRLNLFSVVRTVYKVGNMHGVLGVIGPKRMPYPFLVSAVEYTAKLLQELH
ncbi:MAG: heat-inducible transcription repressor HrcA [Chitinivibrionales bacterium]|nr:heat-inducible transcription repressor HrcA [Chitinivibrionales bacterium]